MASTIKELFISVSENCTKHLLHQVCQVETLVSCIEKGNVLHYQKPHIHFKHCLHAKIIDYRYKRTHCCGGMNFSVYL